MAFAIKEGEMTLHRDDVENLNDSLEPQAVVDELTYLTYAHNRNHAPHASPEDWRCIFGNKIDALEARYQRELSQV
jgi:hypothetical protein